MTTLTPQTNHQLIIIALVLVLVLGLVLVSGCVNGGSYSPRQDDTRANITAYQIKERSILQENSLSFSCYLIDSNDIVYRVKYESDCIRFRIGANYTIVQNYQQYIVFGERLP